MVLYNFKVYMSLENISRYSCPLAHICAAEKHYLARPTCKSAYMFQMFQLLNTLNYI